MLTNVVFSLQFAAALPERVEALLLLDGVGFWSFPKVVTSHGVYCICVFASKASILSNQHRIWLAPGCCFGSKSMEDVAIVVSVGRSESAILQYMDGWHDVVSFHTSPHTQPQICNTVYDVWWVHILYHLETTRGVGG